VVKIINNILPKKTNLDIIRILSESNWKIGTDANESKISRIFSGNHGGFVNLSYIEKTSYDDSLNIYADIVFKKVLEELNIEGVPLRFLWNMYFKNQNGIVHRDKEEKQFISIMYNLHTSDGGIEIDGTFYPDVIGQAKVFESYVNHRGLGPKEDNVRFNLNIIFEIK